MRLRVFGTSTTARSNRETFCWCAMPMSVLLEAYSLVMREVGLVDASAFLSYAEMAHPSVFADRPDHEEASGSVRRYPDQDGASVVSDDPASRILPVCNRRAEVP